MTKDKTKQDQGCGETLGRRDLLSKAVPACGMACFSLSRAPGLFGTEGPRNDQDIHPFDLKLEESLSNRERVRLQYGEFMELIHTLRRQLGEDTAIRVLNEYSAEHGRRRAKTQAEMSPDSTFRSFTAVFRPPAYANKLVHEVVEDSEAVLSLRVTQCVWAEVFKEAGLDGEIGHAAVCNMDYTWPEAFNPRFRMERTRTLMQGHDHCDHRYIQDTE